MVNARRKLNRSEILEIVRSMAEEFGDRAEQCSDSATEAEASRRTARALRELLGVASGQRSGAYWQRRPRSVWMRAAAILGRDEEQTARARLGGSQWAQKVAGAGLAG